MCKKITRCIAILLVLCLVLPGCSSKQKEKALDDFDDPEVENLQSNNEVKTEKVEPSDKSSAGNQTEESEIPGMEEITPVYPGNSAKSALFSFAKEAPEEMFMKDQEELIGRPFKLSGKVTAVFNSADELEAAFPSAMESTGFDLSDIPADQYAALNEALRAFTIETEFGQVLVLDFLKIITDSYKDAYKDNLITLKAYKALYDDLKPYEDFPSAGETIDTFCLYEKYSERANCPIVIYGLSLLNQHGLLKFDYSLYRSGETKHCVYKNLVEFDIPTIWSKEVATGDYSYYMFTDGEMSFDNYDDEDENASITDVMEYYKQAWFGDLTPTIRESVITLDNGATEAYRAVFSMPEDYGSMEGQVVVFKHKHKLVVIWFYYYGTDENRELYYEDFDNILASIKLRGF